MMPPQACLPQKGKRCLHLVAGSSSAASWHSPAISKHLLTASGSTLHCFHFYALFHFLPIVTLGTSVKPLFSQNSR